MEKPASYFAIFLFPNSVKYTQNEKNGNIFSFTWPSKFDIRNLKS